MSRSRNTSHSPNCGVLETHALQITQLTRFGELVNDLQTSTQRTRAKDLTISETRTHFSQSPVYFFLYLLGFFHVKFDLMQYLI